MCADGGAKALLDQALFPRWDGIVPWRLLPASLRRELYLRMQSAQVRRRPHCRHVPLRAGWCEGGERPGGVVVGYREVAGLPRIVSSQNCLQGNSSCLRVAGSPRVVSSGSGIAVDPRNVPSC